MKRYLILLVAVVVVFNVSVVHAAEWAAAAGRVGKVFDDAALNRGIKLSPADRNALTKDILITAKDNEIAPDVITISPIEADKLTTAIVEEGKKSNSPTGSAKAVIVQNKIARVTPSLSGYISTSAAIADVKFSGDVEKIIQNDLASRTKTMAESGLTVKEIQDRNKEYLDMIFHESSSTMTQEGYAITRDRLFVYYPTLAITSTPAGADVVISGSSIGTTPMEKKFESGKKYTFIFSLQGKKMSQRDYYVDPYKERQKLDEILLK